MPREPRLTTKAVLPTAVPCDHGGVHLQPIRPHGTFHARLTVDAEAHRRDGQTYVLINDEGHDPQGERLVETMFEDGIWMLAGQRRPRPAA